MATNTQRTSLFLLLFYCSLCCNAQHFTRQDDILFSKHLVRSIDMQEKGNQQIFGRENLPVRLLLDAYCSGVLTGYNDQELKTRLSYEDFEERLKLLQKENLLPYSELARTLHIVEIGEKLIFDKNRSDFYFDMKSFSIFIPASESYRGIQELLISFDYDACAHIFSGNERAVSKAPLKNGRDINFSSVFLMRLFNSSIAKIGGEETRYFDQQYKNEVSIFLAAKAEENLLTEYLYKLYHPE
jgi:hypothetical protein